MRSFTTKTTCRLLGVSSRGLNKLILSGKIKQLNDRGYKGTKLFNSSDVYELSRELREPKELWY